MRKLITITIITTIFIIISINLAAMQFDLVQFRENPTDFQAVDQPVTDMDMNYCTLIKVEVDNPMDLSLKQKVYQKGKSGLNQYYFYVSAEEKELTFIAPGYEPFNLKPKQDLDMGTTYYVKLNTIRDVDVSIISDPRDASLMVDGQEWSGSQGRLKPGKHYIMIRKEGYKEVQDTIFVSRENAVFNYNLAQSNIPETVHQAASGLLSQEIYGYKVDLVDVQYKQNVLTVSLKITNLKYDRKVTLRKRDTKIYDSNGNEYTPTTIKFANKSKNWNVDHLLVKDITTSAQLICKDIMQPIENIALIKISFWDKSNEYFDLSFKNVPVK